MTSTGVAGPTGAVRAATPALTESRSALLESKLQAPWSRAGLVPRVSLIERLLAAEEPIVAIVAPPGYGKSTLLAQWSEHSACCAAWVSLDNEDNDPVVMLSYIAAALNGVEPFDPTVSRSLMTMADVELGTGLRRLAEAVFAMRVPFVLMLDHAEVIQSRRCWDALAELALNLPSGSQLALASRQEPSLPLARLRAQGLVLDLGAADLAMDDATGAELLAAAGIALNAGELAELMARTEGWPVGLYLATLAVKGSGRRSGLGLSFRGDDRLMADYLRFEVLARLSPVRAAFLVQTSVLDRMCGPLCDAVIGGDGSQQLLESLESSNLLLVPLDRRREWYRYHHLLRDLLRAELARTDPALLLRLHDRAAAWFESQGQLGPAIEHAQAAGDAGRAARLFARMAQLTYASGRADTALGWLSWFEARGEFSRFPYVAVLGAIGEAMLGRPATAERWADAAHSGASDERAPDGSPTDSWIAVLDAMMCRRGVARMRVDAELACERLSPGSPFVGPALYSLAMAHVMDGDDGRADLILERAVEVCQRDGAQPTAAPALAQRAVIAIGRRDWRAAEGFVTAAVATIRDASLDHYISASVVHALAARTAIHRGDIPRAREHVAWASRLRPLCSVAFPISGAYLVQLTHAHLELSDPAGARACLRQVRDILQLRELGRIANEADELARMLDSIHVGTVGASSLTTAELRILPLLPTHLAYHEIGDRVHVSRNTVKSHAVSIYRKLGVTSRGEAVEVAERIGLLGP